MLSDVTYAYRIERSVANMKSDLGNFGAAGQHSVKDLWRKVQAGRGCGNGAFLAREDRLISLPIYQGYSSRAVDIRGKRCFA